jgi:molybdopterin-guanine dinucleotide biosynthesis protein A
LLSFRRCRTFGSAAKKSRIIYQIQPDWQASFYVSTKSTKAPAPDRTQCEICILAGGLSQRMARDKARLRLGRKTMLGHIRAAAKATGLPVRVIRRDSVPRCGPLGGIYTALTTTRLENVLFLPCDMPFVSSELLRTVLAASTAVKVVASDGRPNPRPNPNRNPGRPRARCAEKRALFVRSHRTAGFPFVLRRTTVPLIAEQIKRGHFSLQTLAKVLTARVIRLPAFWSPQLRNINTPQDWALARKLWRSRA